MGNGVFWTAVASPLFGRDTAFSVAGQEASTRFSVSRKRRRRCALPAQSKINGRRCFLDCGGKPRCLGATPL